MKSIRDYINLVTEKDLIAEKVTLPADPSQPVQTQTVNGVTMNAPTNAVKTGSGGTVKSGSGAAVTSGTPAGSSAGLTPDQKQKLGGVDPQDPYLVKKMLGKDSVPISYFTDPESQQIAKRLGFKATVAAAPAAPAQAPAQAQAPAAAPAQAPTAAAPAATPDAAAQASRIADRMDAEAGANTAGTPNAFANKTRLPAGQAAQPATEPAPAAAPATPAGTPPGSVDDEGNLMPGFTKDENGNVVSAGDPNFVEPATQAQATADWTAAKKKEADKGLAAQGLSGNAVNAQGQATGLDVSDDTGKINPNVKKNSETGDLYNPGAAAPSGQAAQPAAPAAPAAPANRDAMPFGKAFADARAKGEKEFMWKGKKYAVKMADTKKPAGQAAQQKTLPGRAAPAGGAANTMDSSVDAMGNITGQYGVMPESTGYSELQRILSIVNHR